jgi:hypothetical protein
MKEVHRLDEPFTGTSTFVSGVTFGSRSRVVKSLFANQP